MINLLRIYGAWVVVLGFSLFVLQIFNNDRISSNEKEIVHLYNQKNNTTFLYLIKVSNPHKPLADILEELSNADPNNEIYMNDLVYRAQNSCDMWEDSLMQIAQLCDQDGVRLTGEYSLYVKTYLFRNSTKIQQNSQIDISKATIRFVLRSISYLYQKDGVNGFTSRERDVLKAISKELRVLENKYYQIQSISKSQQVEFQDEQAIKIVKDEFIKSLEPSLGEISKLTECYQKQVNKPYQK